MVDTVGPISCILCERSDALIPMEWAAIQGHVGLCKECANRPAMRRVIDRMMDRAVQDLQIAGV